jgi:hypothetical protein
LRIATQEKHEAAVPIQGGSPRNGPDEVMTNPISQVMRAAFSVEFSVDKDDAVYVVLAGNGDMEAAPVLGRYVSVLHTHAMQHKSKLINFDLTRLYFFNSSCLKSLASLVTLDSKLVPAEQYKIIFRIGLPWQRRTLAALQGLGRGLVIIEDCIDAASES